MNKVNTILFDLDNTLIDTEKIKSYLYRIAEEHGYDHDHALIIYNEARTDGDKITMSFDNFVQVLKKHLEDGGKKFDQSIVEKVKQEMSSPENGILLEGAIDLIKFCKKRGIEIKLLSLGVSEWQKDKIKLAGLDEYFSEEKGEIVFTDIVGEGKIEAIRKLFDSDDFKGEGVILFNDKPKETADILKEFSEMKAYVVQVKGERIHDRYDQKNYDKLMKESEGKVVVADNLNDLKKNFEARLKTGENTGEVRR